MQSSPETQQIITMLTINNTPLINNDTPKNVEEETSVNTLAKLRKKPSSRYPSTPSQVSSFNNTLVNERKHDVTLIG